MRGDSFISMEEGFLVRNINSFVNGLDWIGLKSVSVPG